MSVKGDRSRVTDHRRYWRNLERVLRASKQAKAKKGKR